MRVRVIGQALLWQKMAAQRREALFLCVFMPFFQQVTRFSEVLRPCS